MRGLVNQLRSAHVSRNQLIAVGVVSALASALIITSALGHSAAQSAALAALAHRRMVVREGGSGTAGAAAVLPPSAGASDSGAGASSDGSGLSSPVAPSRSAPPVPPSSAPPAPPSPSSSGASGGPVTSNQSASASAGTPATTTPKSPVGHVFVIAVSTPSYNAAWGPNSSASYLDHVLKPAGTFLKNYETLGPAELPDYLAMISGQAPNPDTEADCTTYSDFPTGTSPAASGQVPGSGCVYPNTIITIADQVTASGHTWKGYTEGLTQPCVAPSSGALDDAQLRGAGPNYMTRHNPFIYFHSLLDLGGCAGNDVSLAQLTTDLRKLRSTPRYSFIAPGACDDGAAQTCAQGGPAGVAAEDAFLRRWVPRIRHSAAYRKDGVIVIAFAHSSAGDIAGPVRTGALILSRFAAHGKAISTHYDPYSILRGSEDLLGYTLLDHAKRAKSFVPKALPGA